jgi:hypothetical protein
MSLFDPSGKLAENNFPQGASNFGNAQVADPKPGVWIAIVVGIPVTKTLPASLTAHFQASTAHWQSFGSLSASSVTLAPGASGPVTLTVPTPSQPGDQSGSIIVRSSVSTPAFAKVTSIPVTLRSLVPSPSPTTTFSGTLTGGNGRAPATGQTAYYQVQVPPSTPSLNVEVSTADSRNTFLAELVDPTGEAASTATNDLQVPKTGGGTTLKAETGAQLHVLNPAAGRWTLIVDFNNTVAPVAASQPFNVTMSTTPVTASPSGLPDSSSTVLPAGTPVTVNVTVTNNGSTPEEFFIDARTAGQVAQKLAAQTAGSLQLPDLGGVIPTYLVPSHASKLTATVAAKLPLSFDMAGVFGDPDVGSSTSTNATATLTAPDITDGDWTISPTLKGPDVTAVKPVTAHVSVSVTAPAFDSAFNSPTGDLWLSSVTTSSAFTPQVVNPGQTVIIPVTLTPAGTVGTVVTGTLYLDDAWVNPPATSDFLLPVNTMEGSDVAAFPYAYQIGS